MPGPTSSWCPRRSTGGTALFVVPGDAAGLTRTGYRTHDGTRAARVTLDGTPAELLGEGAGDRTADVEQALARARIAYAHEAVGAMDTALTTTSEYLKTRKQFGVPLNKFQALTFRAADMYVSLELVRSIALWATMVLDAGGPTPSRAGRGRPGPAADQPSRPAHRQGGHPAARRHRRHGRVLGGALHLSRLTAIDHLLGDGDWAAGRLAGRIDAGTVEALP